MDFGAGLLEAAITYLSDRKATADFIFRFYSAVKNIGRDYRLQVLENMGFTRSDGRLEFLKRPGAPVLIFDGGEEYEAFACACAAAAVKSGVHVKAVAVVEGVLADMAGRKTRKSKKDKKVVKEKVIINVVNDGRPVLRCSGGRVLSGAAVTVFDFPSEGEASQAADAFEKLCLEFDKNNFKCGASRQESSVALTASFFDEDELEVFTMAAARMSADMPCRAETTVCYFPPLQDSELMTALFSRIGADGPDRAEFGIKKYHEEFDDSRCLFATVSVADEAAAADKIAEIINDLFTEDR